jgi:hypothetical protein
MSPRDSWSSLEGLGSHANDVALLLRTRMLADARNHKQLRLKHAPTAASACHDARPVLEIPAPGGEGARSVPGYPISRSLT